MDLKSLYFAVEDKYYEALDWINQYVPIYKLVDPIDKFAPSLLVFVGIFVLLVAGSAFLVFFQSTPSFDAYIKVTDDLGKPLSNVDISLDLDDNSQILSTNDNGVALARIKSPVQTGKISLFVDKYQEIKNQSVTLEAGKTLSLKLTLSAIALSGPVTIQFLDRGELVRTRVSFSFRCEHGDAPAAASTTSGEYTVEPAASCGNLDALNITAEGYTIKTVARITRNSQGKAQVFLDRSVPPQAKEGTLTVTVLNSASQPVGNAEVIVYGNAQATDGETELTTALGIASFTLEEGSYDVMARIESQGRVSDRNTVEITEDSQTRLTLKLSNASTDKKIRYKFVDANTGDSLSDVSVKVFVGNTVLIENGQSDSQGIFESPVSAPNLIHNMVADKTEYVIKLVENVTLNDFGDSNAHVASLDRVRTADDGTPVNYSQARVSVVDEEFKPVSEPQVQLFAEGWLLPFFEKKASTDGNALFSRLPVGDFFVTAIKDDVNAQSEPESLELGDTVDFELTLQTAKRFFRITAQNALAVSEKVNNADVKIFTWDGLNAVQVGNGTTNASGVLATNLIKANQWVYFVITRSDYLSYTSSLYYTYLGNQSSPIELSFGMLKTADAAPGSTADSQLDIQFVGLQNESGYGSVPILESGKKYFALFRLVLKQGSYSGIASNVSAGPDSALGASQGNSGIEDSLSVPWPNSVVFSSSLDAVDVFTPTDSINANSTAKTVNMGWNQLNSGVYETRVLVSVKPDLVLGTVVELHFQSRGQSAVGLGLTERKIQAFRIGDPACSSDCPPVYWQFFYSNPPFSSWTTLDLSSPPSLITNQETQIGYRIYNLTGAALVADLNFENPDLSLGLDKTSGKPVTTIFSDQAIAANQSYESVAPLELLPQSGTHGILVANLGANGLTDPALTQLLDFPVTGNKELTLNVIYSESTLIVLAKDTQTQSALQNAIVSIGEINQGSVLDGFGGVPSQTDPTNENGEARFDNITLNENEFVIVEVRKAEYQTKRQQVNGETAILMLNPLASCLTLDMTAATSEVNDSVVSQQNGSADIVLSASGCEKSYEVEIKVPDFADELSVEEPASFTIENNQSVTKHIGIPLNSPPGIIPVWVEGKAVDAQGSALVLALGEIWLTQNDHIRPADNVCFGLVQTTQPEQIVETGGPQP